MEKGLMSSATLAEYLDIKKTKLYELCQTADFPKPVYLNKATIQSHRYWLRSSIDNWLNNLQLQADEQN